MILAHAISLDDAEVARLFLALAVLLTSALVLGYLAQLCSMPKVIGEICAGMLLGPTVLGHICPPQSDWLFNGFAAEGKLIAIFYWLGLVLLMFISGFEIQKSVSTDDRRTILALLLGGTLIPFLAGWLFPVLCDVSSFIGEKNNPMALNVVIGIAVAVTSIPVISKIFIDLGIIRTRFAKIILATATIEDVILWAALAVVTALVSGAEVSAASILWTMLLTILFLGLGLFLFPAWIRRCNTLRWNLLIRSSVTGYALVICLVFAFLASAMHINIVFGALVAGLVIGSMPDETFGPVRTRIRDVSLGFFVPIYFAVVGLKLDLVHHLDVPALLGFLLFATLFKTAGTLAAARLTRNDWLSSFNLSVAMNTRGGPGIVLATVAFELGIISEKFFVILILVAIITSLLAGYWFSFVLARHWPLLGTEPSVSVEPPGAIPPVPAPNSSTTA